MKKFIVIQIKVSNKKTYSVADFNAKEYEKQNSITLIGEPLEVTYSDGKLTLVYEGKEEERKKKKLVWDA